MTESPDTLVEVLAELEDDEATVFNSSAAQSLERSRCLGFYVPPAASVRRRSLTRARELAPELWQYFEQAALVRSRNQRREAFVPVALAAGKANVALLAALESLDAATSAASNVARLLAWNDLEELEQRIADFLDELANANRRARLAQEHAAWIARRVAAGKLVARAHEPSEEEREDTKTEAGFVRLVFREAAGDHPALEALVSRGSSRVWTLLGSAFRLTPALEEGTDAFDTKEATWRRTVARIFVQLGYGTKEDIDRLRNRRAFQLLRLTKR